MSVIVNTEANGSYEPSEGEIIEYGKWLGMQLPEDNPFLWIAREGLKVPLPENWKACQSDKGELYYFNFKTGQSSWDHPMDEHFKELFKNEKLNPTTRSITAGAKRKDTADSAKKEDKSGPRKKQREKSAKRSEAGERQGDLSPISQGSDEAKEGGSRMKALKSLKIKKEMPKEMRIEFDGPSPDKKTPHTQQASVGMPEFRVATTQSESSEEIIPTPKRAEKKAASAALKQAESPTVGGGVGLKSLRALSETNRVSPLGEDNLAEEIRRASTTLAAEKEKLEKTTKEELEKLRVDLAASRKAQEEELRASNAKAIDELQKKYEKDLEAKKSELQNRLDQTVKQEVDSMTEQVKASVEQAKKDMASQKSHEVRRIKENYKEQLEQERKKISDEFAENLEAFRREQKEETDARKEQLANSLRECGVAFETEMQRFCSTAVRSYEDGYFSFLKSVASSQNDFALRSIQQKEETQRELDTQLEDLRKAHAERVERENDFRSQELERIRAEHSAERERLSQANARELDDLRAKATRETEEFRATHERETLPNAMAELREKNQRELDTLKNELRKQAEEELKAAMTELAQEHKSRVATSMSPRDHEVKAKIELEQSPAMHHGSGAAAGLPPRLNGELLYSDSPTPDAYNAIRDSQTKDIKTAVTEALREVFAGSPFTLPSPGRASVSVSPSRQEAAASRRASVPGSAAAGGEIGISAKPHKSTGFTFPMSFRDQCDLVESERQRVREGRRFVEAQRKNLEERRQQLKRTRHQWKQDVMVAKEEGVRSSSKRGQLLNKVRVTLEEQAKGLEFDEAILHESMTWLQSKEQRLVQLEQQIEEQERVRALGDNSTMNCSVDTAALVTGYFKPQRAGMPDALGRRMSQSLGIVSGANFTPFESPASTPVVSNALSRIERRLDEVASLVNWQKSQALSPSHSQSPSRKINTTTPTLGQAQGRQRQSRNHAKAVDQGREAHVDMW